MFLHICLNDTKKKNNVSANTCSWLWQMGKWANAFATCFSWLHKQTESMRHICLSLSHNTQIFISLKKWRNKNCCWNSKTTSIYSLSDMNINCDTAEQRTYNRFAMPCVSCVHIYHVSKRNVYISAMCVCDDKEIDICERKKKNTSMKNNNVSQWMFHQSQPSTSSISRLENRFYERQSETLSPSVYWLVMRTERHRQRKRVANSWMRHLNSSHHASIRKKRGDEKSSPKCVVSLEVWWLHCCFVHTKFYRLISFEVCLLCFNEWMNECKRVLALSR